MWKWFLDLLASLFGGGATTPPPPPPPPDNRDVFQQLLAAHNYQRKQHSLPPLFIDPRLAKAAQAHSQWMASHDNMSHNEGSVTPAKRITDAGYNWRSMGENIAEGFQTVSAVMNAWMSSSGHKHNILGDYRDVGFGVVGNWWTADFALPLGKYAVCTTKISSCHYDWTP